MDSGPDLISRYGDIALGVTLKIPSAVERSCVISKGCSVVCRVIYVGRVACCGVPRRNCVSADERGRYSPVDSAADNPINSNIFRVYWCPTLRSVLAHRQIFIVPFNPSFIPFFFSFLFPSRSILSAFLSAPRINHTGAAISIRKRGKKDSSRSMYSISSHVAVERFTRFVRIASKWRHCLLAIGPSLLSRSVLHASRFRIPRLLCVVESLRVIFILNRTPRLAARRNIRTVY